MWHEVVLVEQLCALSGFRYKMLSLTYMRDNDVADISIELLSRQMFNSICAKLLLHDLSQASNLLSALVHEVSLLLHHLLVSSLNVLVALSH